MNMTEYKKIERAKLTYREYCKYLQLKYGEAKYDYFTKSWNKNPKVTRTKEGLICHHICEDVAIMLSEPKFAQNNPFEFQSAKNLCYCDYLEHLLLHIMICESPDKNHNEAEAVGIGGVINYLVPELNDFYSGWITGQTWRANCHELIRNDKEVYLELLKRFKHNCQNYPFFAEKCLYTSFNEPFGLWSRNKNQKLFKEIESL